MSWWGIAKDLALRGIGLKSASPTKVVAGPATFSADSILAGLDALMGIDLGAIKRELDEGQFVTAGVMALDDVLLVVGKFVPQAAMAEKIVHVLVQLGQISLAHNSGEGGIGASPEGPSNVVTP